MTELKPFKIVGQLIAAAYDDDGNIVGEQVAGDVVFYATQFGEVQERVRVFWENSGQMKGSG